MSVNSNQGVTLGQMQITIVQNVVFTDFTTAVLQTQEFPLRGIFMFYLILQRFYGLKVLKTLLSLDDDLKAVTLDPAQLQNHGALAWL